MICWVMPRCLRAGARLRQRRPRRGLSCHLSRSVSRRLTTPPWPQLPRLFTARRQQALPLVRGRVSGTDVRQAVAKLGAQVGEREGVTGAAVGDAVDAPCQAVAGSFYDHLRELPLQEGFAASE